MAVNEYMQKTEDNLVHTYNRFPVTFERGEGEDLEYGEKTENHRT